MLEELHVSNLGLIAEARVEPGPGLVVVTGETGAGKTMLLGALGLLGGESARRDRVGPAADAALVEGRFVDGEGAETVVARRVTAEGRSRAYEDGAMVTARHLADVVGPRIEIVAQHDALRLARSGGILALVDGALGAQDLLEDYGAAWNELQRLRQEKHELGGDPRALERELDAARLQAEEIAAANLEPEEISTLSASASRLRNAEELAAGLGAAHGAFTQDAGVLDRLGDAIAELRRLARLDSGLEPLYQRAVEGSDAIAELAAEISSIADSLEHDDEALRRVEDRIGLIGVLRRKYGDTVAEIIHFGAAAELRAGELVRLLAAAETLDDDLAKAERRAIEAGSRLGEARRRRASEMAAVAEQHLRDLGMSNPRVGFEFESTPPTAGGTDRIQLVFASDGSLTPGPVSRIASGGELSRLVLALRLAAGAGDVAIVAFDEIDAGVGGATALAMGEKLWRLARGRQVLCVSHLPQIAAFADSHIVVTRDGATATVSVLDSTDRVVEIARMLSGLEDTDTGLEHAEELLAVAAARRS